MIRVQRVEPGSIAEELEIEPGSVLLTLNGHTLRDGLDLLYYQAEDRVELEAETGAGQRVVYEIEKDADTTLGVVPEPDKVRRCTNACPFCFVKGNPKFEKLRGSLYIKDDDYRLSFLYGHYVTLTNLRDDDWERIFEQRLSPLYVSVHATDPDVRLEMLKNPRSARVLEDLDRLLAGGISLHAQVVLCPALNDGHTLDRTIDELYVRAPGVRSLLPVPVGSTRYNEDRGVRPLTRAESRRAIEQVDRARQRAAVDYGYGWCYAADELFLQAELDAPGREYFDEGELESNGVGSISWLEGEIRRGLGDLRRLDGRKVVLVTGRSMGPSLTRLAAEIAATTGATIDTVVADNTLYGPAVTTAGLLSGADHLAALEPFATHDLALFSRHALNDHDRFLDELSLGDLRSRLPGLRVEPSDNVIDVLGSAA